MRKTLPAPALLAAGALATIAALAGPAQGVPSPALCTVPTHVLMVGRLDDAADTALGAFTIVVRNLADNPMPGALVECRVLNCSGARLATNALQTNVLTRCDTHEITAVAGIDGSVRMTLVGGGTPGSPPGTGPCMEVYAESVLIGTASVATLDLDGINGLGINDLSLWLSDFGLNEPISRSDFDGDGKVDINDLSVWLEAWSRGTSAESATSYCP